MPFDGEFASYKPLARILTNDKVKDAIARCQKSPSASLHVVRPQFLTGIQSAFLPNLVLAIDGSYHQVSVANGYPASELACVTAAAVLIDLNKQRRLDAQRPVDPRAFRTTQDTTAIDCALPGCNVILDEPTPQGSFRRQFYQETAAAAGLLGESGESLLETYEVLLALKPSAARDNCPYMAACHDADMYGQPRPITIGAGVSTCPCSAARPVFSTDALRMHEGFNPNGPSGAMFAEAMQVWERLWVVNFLRNLERKGLLTAHLALAIILDGPLAVFGHPAWLSQAISKELYRLNRAAQQKGADILLVGIEKTGAFVDHFVSLDAPDRGTGKSPIPDGSVFLLTEDYIRSNIVLSEGKTYGKDTYFGRKLFYKTTGGSRLVATLPFFHDDHRDLTRADISQFPRLADALSLLDVVFSVRYPHAVGPLVVAHAEAAIPLHAGQRAFEQLIQHLVQH